MLVELNKTVFRQRQRIEMLQTEVRTLRERLQKDDDQDVPRDLGDEEPTYYLAPLSPQIPAPLICIFRKLFLQLGAPGPVCTRMGHRRAH